MKQSSLMHAALFALSNPKNWNAFKNSFAGTHRGVSIAVINEKGEETFYSYNGTEKMFKTERGCKVSIAHFKKKIAKSTVKQAFQMPLK